MKNTPVNPRHYSKYEIQPIEFILRNKLDFIQGCIVKYILRYRDKDGKQDLRKIIQYAEFAILDLDRNNGREFVRTSALGVFTAMTNFMDEKGDLTLVRYLPCTLEEARRLFKMAVQDKPLKDYYFMFSVLTLEQFSALNEDQRSVWIDIMKTFESNLISHGYIKDESQHPNDRPAEPGIAGDATN